MALKYCLGKWFNKCKNWANWKKRALESVLFILVAAEPLPAASPPPAATNQLRPGLGLMAENTKWSDGGKVPVLDFIQYLGSKHIWIFTNEKLALRMLCCQGFHHYSALRFRPRYHCSYEHSFFVRTLHATQYAMYYNFHSG